MLVCETLNLAISYSALCTVGAQYMLFEWKFP